VHNCTKCRQCLPKVFQQEGPPSDGETQSKVLLAVPCASAFNFLREPCGVPGGSVVEARKSGCPGGRASVPQGLICDRKASDLAPTQVLWTAGTADGVRRSGCPGGHASVPQGLISDHPTSQIIWEGTWSTEMVNEIQVKHGNQLSNKSQEQLRSVNKALMYVLKELGAASRRLVITARLLRQQIPAVGRRHSELRNVRLVIGGGRQRARRRN
jgi:hypothetical protein